jgi:hypothetical protein
MLLSRPLVFLVPSVLAAATTFFPAEARAQSLETGVRPAVSKETGRRYGGAGFFMGGGMLADHDGMNDALAARGLPELPSALVLMGSGGYFRFNRILVGGEGYWSLARSGSSATHETSVTGGMGFFDFGYIVASFGSLAVFPMVGLGGGGLTYTVARKTSGTFEQALDDPARGARFSTGGFMGHLSIGLDHMFDMRKEPNEAGGPMVGLRIGYAMQLPKGDWSVYGSDVAGGPEVGLGGPFLRLVIGGGGMEVE